MIDRRVLWIEIEYARIVNCETHICLPERLGAGAVTGARSAKPFSASNTSFQSFRLVICTTGNTLLAPVLDIVSAEARLLVKSSHVHFLHVRTYVGIVVFFDGVVVVEVGRRCMKRPDLEAMCVQIEFALVGSYIGDLDRLVIVRTTFVSYRPRTPDRCATPLDFEVVAYRGRDCLCRHTRAFT